MNTDETVETIDAFKLLEKNYVNSVDCIGDQCLCVRAIGTIVCSGSIGGKPETVVPWPHNEKKGWFGNEIMLCMTEGTCRQISDQTSMM